ncbi:MAG: hypothetical protein M0R20_03970 [Candidatus Omnitrophica bacterium]|jgi:hypothetical protein|nr:hypothetical protein [Candidatus Omnitrophota bacterium]
MVRCKICKVPLAGFLSNIGKAFFNIRRSEGDPEVCNKCANKKQEALTEGINPDDKTYQCQICSRAVHQQHALEHVKAEEYLIELIKKDHPEFRHKGPTCKECIEYYRKLIKNAEI